MLEELPRPDGKLTKEQLDPVVAAARTGDPDAVQALLRLIKPTVVRYCRARIGGRDLSYLSADDVAQEVCLAVLKVLPELPGPRRLVPVPGARDRGEQGRRRVPLGGAGPVEAGLGAAGPAPGRQRAGEPRAGAWTSAPGWAG